MKEGQVHCTKTPLLRGFNVRLCLLNSLTQHCSTIKAASDIDYKTCFKKYGLKVLIVCCSWNESFTIAKLKHHCLLITWHKWCKTKSIDVSEPWMIDNSDCFHKGLTFCSLALLENSFWKKAIVLFHYWFFHFFYLRSRTVIVSDVTLQ